MKEKKTGFAGRNAVMSLVSALKEYRGDDGLSEKPSKEAITNDRQFAVKSFGDEFVLYETTDGAGVFPTTRSTERSYSARVLNQASDTKSVKVFALKSRDEGVAVWFSVANHSLQSVVRASWYIGPLPHLFSIGRYFLSEGISFGDFAYEFCAIEDDGGYFFLDTDIDRLEIEKSCSLHSIEPIMLPNVIITEGDFSVIDSTLTRSPSSAHVKGDLILRGIKNLIIPKIMSVGGDFAIEGSDASELPSGFSVGRDLNISCTNIESLPQKFHVGRHVVATGSKLSKIHSMTHVKGNLILKDCPIKTLPKGLEVDGDLDISNTNIKNLPADMLVGGDLYINNGDGIPKSTRVLGDILCTENYIM